MLVNLQLVKRLFVCVILILPVTALSLSAEQQGLEIAKEAVKRNEGWKSSSSSIKMILKNRQGNTSIREIRSKNLEVLNDGDKGLTIFDKPNDVKGTAFLSYTHPNSPDEQWIYLPALKRLKRISSSNKSGPFMGSEFAYEDLNSFEIEKYKYKYLKDENINGLDCFVVEMYPQYQHSGYTRIIGWLDKEYYRIIQSQFYDRKNSLLKTLNYSDYTKYLDKFWRAHTMEMKNHQTGKSTILKFNDYNLDIGLTDNDFKMGDLKRAK